MGFGVSGFRFESLGVCGFGALGSRFGVFPPPPPRPILAVVGLYYSGQGVARAWVA